MRCLSVLLLFALSLVNGYRLSKNVMPKNYQLSIWTPLSEQGMKSKFQGRVEITISCVYPTSNITLHSKDLNISEEYVSIRDAISEGSEAVKGLRITYEKEHDFLIIHLDKPLIKDQTYKINIPYWGIINNGSEGFYRTSYKDSKTGKDKWLGVTQFDPIYARRAFPCFDEPAMKATFRISIARREGFTSISNMPWYNTHPVHNSPGWFYDQFITSELMSTYLVAWVVSDFEAKESKHEFSNVTFKIWTKKDALHQATGASEVGPKVLRFFENYFGIQYPLPKLDIVAVPEFSSDILGSWGLLICREQYLLYDPNVSTKSNQRETVSIIVHQLSHQWIGNLVTINWWTDIWLNKGFATYMAVLALHHLFPEWDSLEDNIADAMLSAFLIDSTASAHPVSVSIGDPSKELRELFDKLGFIKGSSLIRMTNMFLGEETFRSGVTNFLKQHSYGNAEPNDLWSSLTEVAHMKKTLPENFTMKEIMDTWTHHTGFPVIYVKRNYDTGSAEITQKPALPDTTKLKPSNPCWWVPLTYSTKSEPHFNITTPKYWLNCDTGESKIIKHIANKDDWVVFNNKMSGYYKVHYDEANWRMLAGALKKDHKQIPALNRMLLFNDAADLARIGDLPYEVFFDLLGYLEHETKYFVFNVALEELKQIGKDLKFHPEYELVADYIKTLLTPLYKKVGGFAVRAEDQENANEIKTQIRIVRLSCRYEVQQCQDDAQKLFKENEEHPDEPNPIPKDLTDVVYCNALAHGGVKEWNFVWGKYLNSNVANEKIDIMRVLAGCPREAWLLNRYLEWSLNVTKIPKEDSSFVFTWVSSSDLGYFIAKKFFYKNVEKLAQYLNEENSLNTYITALIDSMRDLEDVEELENFNKKHDNILSDITKIVDQTRKTIKTRTEWQAKHGQEIQEALKKYSYKLD